MTPGTFIPLSVKSRHSIQYLLLLGCCVSGILFQLYNQLITEKKERILGWTQTKKQVSAGGMNVALLLATAHCLRCQRGKGGGDKTFILTRWFHRRTIQFWYHAITNARKAVKNNNRIVSLGLCVSDSTRNSANYYKRLKRWTMTAVWSLLSRFFRHGILKYGHNNRGGGGGRQLTSLICGYVQLYQQK